MSWPTSILLCVLAASLAFATVQFAGCAAQQHAQYEACVASQSANGTNRTYNIGTRDAPDYIVVTPC